MGLAPRLWLLVSALSASSPAFGQSQGLVVRDGTLGSAPPGVVAPGLDDIGHHADYLIRADLGEQRGGNLFHSFQRFSIGSGERATFTGQGAPDPGAIENVISRVTGEEPSTIDGSTIPDADVWLLNPSGVVFGEGAQLDVPGSFHASTGDYLGFGESDLVRFYADPARPSVLSTAPPAAFGFLGEDAAAPISVTGATLAMVRSGDGIELAGGDVTLSGATLDAPGGAVSIRGGRIVIREGSKVLAENAGEDPAGTVTVDGSGSIVVDDSVLSVNTSSSGDAGTIRVTGNDVVFRNGPGFLIGSSGQLAAEMGARAETSDEGSAGVISIEAAELTVTRGAFVSARTLGLAAKGDGGRIEISARSVDVAGFANAERFFPAVIDVSAIGSQSDAGTIQIEARQLRLDAGNVWALADGADTTPGRIEIDLIGGSIELVNGGTIDSGCFGCTSTLSDPDRPDGAGTIRVVANDMLVEGVHPLGAISGVYSATGGGGDAGDINVELTGRLELLRGGELSALTLGSGNAGHIEVHADSLLIRDPAPLNTGIFVGANLGSTGDAGRITVDARSVQLEKGAFIFASSVGAGRAGTIEVKATESILVSNEGGDRFSLSRAVAPGPFEPLVLAGIFTGTTRGGDGGPITLEAPDITVTDGAIISSGTVGGGRGSDVLLRGERIHVVDGGIVSSASLPFGTFAGPIPGGPAGSVMLEATESIEVAGRHPEFGDPSRVGTSTVGSGEAGAITFHAPQILVDGGFVSTTAVPARRRSEAGAGGDITLVADDVLVRGGGRVDASSFVGEPGGKVQVTAGKSIVVEGEGSGIASRTGGGGDGGGVALRAPGIEVSGGGDISAQSARGFEELGELIAIVAELLPTTAPEATGNAGAVTLVADELRLEGGTIATNAEAADGGDVTIRAKQLVHLDAGEITAAVSDGSGGNISIDPEVVILQNGSRIVANAGAGSGGNIQITADNYFAFPGSVVDASSALGVDGVVEVHAPDVDLAGKITALPTTFLDAASLMRERCAARRSGERAGSFAVRGNGGTPPEPDGWLSASVPAEVELGTVPVAQPTAAPGSRSGPFDSGTCR